VESMRGMRLGSQSLETERGVELSARQQVEFACPAGHSFEMVFAQDVELPETWDCKSCSAIATRMLDGEPVPSSFDTADLPRTHYDMVLERRSREELEELLQEMLQSMRERRQSGKLSA
jgi:hypothetical protein